MFDIGFQEILMVSVLALLVMGPERLPGAIRTGTLWLAKIRRSFADMKQEIENEVGINPDQINLQLHNEQVLKSIEENKKLLKDNVDALAPDLKELENDIRDFAVHTTAEAAPPASNTEPKPNQAHELDAVDEHRDDGHASSPSDHQNNSNKPL